MSLIGNVTGTGRSANWLQRALDQIRRQRIVSGAGYKVTETPRGTTLEFPPSKGGGPGGEVECIRCEVTSTGADFLLANRLDTNEQIIVAKPENLRRSSFHGLTINGITYQAGADAQTRTARQTVRFNNQDITLEILETVDPSYIYVRHIYVMKAKGGTGADVFGEEPVWIDINVSARYWKPNYKDYPLCLGGEAWAAIFSAGEPVKIPPLAP